MSAKIGTLIENGREEITTKEELQKYDRGSLISYLNKDDILKPGGFLVKKSNDYFIYITPDFTQKYRVRYKNVNKMWVGNPSLVKRDIISFAPSSQEITKFPVKIGDTVIYYARNGFQFRRYMSTSRFQTIIKWYEYFHNEQS